MKCKQCGHWNSIEVEKVMLNPDSREPKVRVFLPAYLPLKRKNVLSALQSLRPKKELIRLVQERFRHSLSNNSA